MGCTPPGVEVVVVRAGMLAHAYNNTSNALSNRTVGVQTKENVDGSNQGGDSIESHGVGWSRALSSGKVIQLDGELYRSYWTFGRD